MKMIIAVLLLSVAASTTSQSQKPSSVNGEPLALFSPDPQYTKDAAKARVKGTVRLSLTIDTHGCAKDIKVVTPLGHGLDESSVSALQRWRFRRPSKPIQTVVEINFDPVLSSRNAVTGATCGELAARVPTKNN